MWFILYQQVFDNEGIEFADKIRTIFQNVSSSSNIGISELFKNIGRTILIPGYDYYPLYLKIKEKFKRGKKKYSSLSLQKYLNL